MRYILKYTLKLNICVIDTIWLYYDDGNLTHIIVSHVYPLFLDKVLVTSPGTRQTNRQIDSHFGWLCFSYLRMNYRVGLIYLVYFHWLVSFKTHYLVHTCATFILNAFNYLSYTHCRWFTTHISVIQVELLHRKRNGLPQETITKGSFISHLISIQDSRRLPEKFSWLSYISCTKFWNSAKSHDVTKQMRVYGRFLPTKIFSAGESWSRNFLWRTM